MKFAFRFKSFIVFYIAITEYFCRVPSGNCVCWNIINHATSCLDYRAFSNFYTTEYYYPATEPYAVLNCDVFEHVGIVVRYVRSAVKIVVLSNKKAVRARMEVISNRNFAPTIDN